MARFRYRGSVKSLYPRQNVRCRSFIPREEWTPEQVRMSDLIRADYGKAPIDRSRGLPGDPVADRPSEDAEAS